ncbi:hypothetical protein JJB09_12830 [Rhizobium sp. KVB221]|uniref:Uncharacterized protein n=1 Tax=Rhizobium setariae TaxID=2801340 RepID=A0A936YU44_9HYPH|nr:hypothetical protein [Rhizobium setariae]MBL0372912.1 hypothetical protein [Rhizobium setariae]
MSTKLLLSACGVVLAALAFSQPANALTMKECSAKYKTAKADGSDQGLKWNDFRTKFCGDDATAEPEVSLDSNEEPAKPTAKAPRGVMFPSKVSAKYSSETAGKARLHTCVDAYHENKKNNTLNGLKWIQKGGGYYSLCNAKLKS